MTTQLELRDKVVTVEYQFHRGEDEVRNYGDGSGYPGDGARVDILRISGPSGMDHSRLIYKKSKKLAEWIENMVLAMELRWL
jgi:hypothetical protein